MRINWKKANYFSWRRKFYAKFKLQNGILLSVIQGDGCYSDNTNKRVPKNAIDVKIGFLRNGKLIHVGEAIAMFPHDLFEGQEGEDIVLYDVPISKLKRFVKKYLR